MTLPEPFAVTMRVIEALEALHVPYLLGGSFASAVHGSPRSTRDADIVAILSTADVDGLAQRLEGEFYFDIDTMRRAVQRRDSFNLIHLKTMFKVDIFVSKNRPYDQAQMAHRLQQSLDPGVLPPVHLASAEDTILTKLNWYRLGGEVSERQWHDVIGVIKVQGNRLDQAYLRRWAADLGVSDLLEQTLHEAIQ